MTAPLSDITVLDFSTLLPGPMASLFLAEAGAEVIKIERSVTGEEMRSYHPRWGQESTNFAMLNRGKKSLALDLKDPVERDRLIPLIKRADVLLEQFRPGVMARLGLDYETVAKINPKIIYCSITGYGQTGPKRNTAGHDLNYIADSGLLSVSSGSVQHPVLPPALIADIAGGTYPALLNILLALRSRDQSGAGCQLDIAMAQNTFPFIYWALGNGQAVGEWPVSGKEKVTGGSPRYQLYPAEDGRFVAVGALEQKFWAAFTDAIGLEESQRDDKRDPEATQRAVAVIIASRTSSEWEPVLKKADCCCSIVKTVEEAMQDPHFNFRGVFDEQVINEEGATMSSVPVPIAKQFRARIGTPVAAPSLGQENDKLLS